ncbi:receptor-type tyrosine-protein phosphatase eta isoform X2 [Protopterus annectens]|uniref:receptor-type tyrosine-protein phosphatase eta isoform X2 n=1 Tax=Protopterus annectens TaxID=7888 RepID=UPI001CFAD1A2|nr:receptor-type tyrosine-protein phosphatase eta isoform X2 [Protopterus annectens]
MTVTEDFVTITGLTPGGSYSVSISAVSWDNTTVGDNVVISSSTRPEKISNVFVRNDSTTSLLLMWTAPSGLHSYYIVYIIKNSGNSSTNMTVMTDSANITGLTPGGSYNVSISAVSWDNTTVGDNVATSISTKPEKVTDLITVNVTVTSISLTWTAPVGLHSYYIVTASGSPSVTNNVTKDNVTITGLISGASYIISVVAVSYDQTKMGDSAIINGSTKPGPIKELTVKNITTTYLYLTWMAADGEYSYFMVNVSGDKLKNMTVKDVFANITDLTPGGNYSISVSPVSSNDKIIGESTVIYNSTKPEKVTNLNIINVTTTSLYLTWTEPEGLHSYYIVNATGASSNSIPVTTDYVNMTGLIPGGNYSISVSAYSYDETTLGEATVKKGSTKPEKVTNLNIINVTTTSLYLTWTEPEGLHSYYIVNATGASSNSTPVTTDYVNMTGLIPGGNYSISVSAYSYDETTLGEATVTSGSTEPEKVTNLNIPNVTTTSLYLTWTAPEGLHSYYIVNATGASSNSIPVTTDYVNMTGLIPGGNYSISVSAYSYDRTTLGEATVTNGSTKPEKVTNLNIINVTTTSLYLTWTAPEGLHSYYIVNATGASSNSIPVTTDYVNMTGLIPGGNYSISVSAYSYDGTTLGKATVTNGSTKPGKVKDLAVANKTTTSLYVTWTAPDGKYSKFKVSLDGATNSSEEVQTQFVNMTGLLPGEVYRINVTVYSLDATVTGEVSEYYNTTRPTEVSDLRAENVTTTKVDLKWIAPKDYKESYKYIVQSTYDMSNYINKFETANFTTVENLTSGANYNFSVTVVTQDGTKGKPFSIQQCIPPGSVLAYPCISPVKSNKISLKWTCPNGLKDHFVINVTDPRSIVMSINKNVTCSAGTQQTEDITGLLYSTTYSVIISTVSCSTNSASLTCNTSITDPPPPHFYPLLSPSITSSSFTFSFDPNIFDSTNGPIIAYAVIVATTDDGNSEAVLAHTYDEFMKKAYSSYVAKIIKINPDGTTRAQDAKAQSSPISVTVGDDTTANGYKNGKLQPLGTYRYKIYGLTKVESDSTSKLIPSECYFSYTNYSQPFTLPQDTGVIVGAVLGTLLGIAVIIIIILLIINFRRHESKVQGLCPFFTKSRTPANATPMSNKRRVKTNNPVALEKFENYYKSQHADSNCGFAQDFEDLRPVGIDQFKRAAEHPENKQKNRYANVLPYDVSRVKLHPIHNPSDDYINANYMPGYFSKQEFIATQGPLANTLNDFWRMIWEKNVHTIVMLTRCIEQGRAKCEEYWPNKGQSQSYGDISIESSAEICLPEWTIRDFTLRQTKEERLVRQFHYTAWPDHGVPETTELLINFRHLVRQHMNDHQDCPTIVHCSAGVGRTGTFISIDRIIYQVENDNHVDIYGIVHDLRMHRPLMVQTEDQYVFLNQCALDFIKSHASKNGNLIYENTAVINTGIYENISPTGRVNGYC